ncbi:undecaprenyldiphospho-muramoylpentapeptide beta-N-acetylglucosaminyltransferase [Desulfurivibrio sp. D14AmB]|uniref:undecaprenyldiphospho-muramoylpentapeptide beta-N-acetylglucosaminyltransferase n=1 Tax=Desulfurivibrio sp. D14AmB TaxID=3374370 RepID=UPI00376EAA4D
MSLRLVITGGGTGGHLFPGIAVADAVLSGLPGSEVLFIGTGREIDRKALADKPYRQATLTGSGLKGISWRGRLASLARLPVGLWQAWRLLRGFKPDLVLGVGGYVTGPVLLAARLMGITTGIHEQNSVPGLANRLLGRFVDLVFLSLPGSEGGFPPAKIRLVGNPLRPELLAAAQKMEMASPPSGEGDPVLLVLGGSQGARRVNRLVLEAVAELVREGQKLRVVHQTGSLDLALVQQGYREMGVAARVEPFITEMAAVYAGADLVVSRAGATTLAELALFGKPALLIPYPYAADDHQRHNAEIMARQGAARVLKEAELSGAELAAELRNLLADPERRQEMAARARELATPEAAQKIIAQGRALAGV